MQPPAAALDLSRISIAHIESSACLAHFSCGNHDIDRWAKSKSYKLHSHGRARVYVARSEGIRAAVGFYSVSLSHQKQDKLQSDQRDRWQDGAPLFYLDWVATDRHFQRMRLGTFMLMDALQRAHMVSETVPIYGVALRSLNEQTTKLYSTFGFAKAPGEDQLPLMILPIWSIRDLLS